MPERRGYLPKPCASPRPNGWREALEGPYALYPQPRHVTDVVSCPWSQRLMGLARAVRGREARGLLMRFL